MLIAFGLFLGPIFWTGIVWLGNAAVLASIATLGYHGVLWLLNGTWTGWSFSAALAAAGVNDLLSDSGSANGVIQSILALPVALGLAGAGLLVVWIGSAARAAGTRRGQRKPQERG